MAHPAAEGETGIPLGAFCNRMRFYEALWTGHHPGADLPNLVTLYDSDVGSEARARTSEETVHAVSLETWHTSILDVLDAFLDEEEGAYSNKGTDELRADVERTRALIERIFVFDESADRAA